MALRVTEEEFQDLRRRIGVQIARETMRDYGVKDAKITIPDEKPKRSKYGNVRTEVNGIMFDSKHEARVYTYLMLRVREGELMCVLRQVRFDLPGGIRYVADFVTIGPDMRIEGVYDAKSEITKRNRVYINKKKQMKAIWGIDIKEV